MLDAANAVIGSRIVRFPLTPEACAERLYFNVSASHPAMMIRHKVFESLAGYSEDYPAAEDFDLLWRASKAGYATANLPDVLLIKDENPHSISQMRRRRQIHSRLRIQWANSNLTSASSWLGLAKTILTLALPVQAINILKGISKRRG